MKAYKKRVRLIRSLAIAGSLAALTVPSAAGAMPIGGDPPSSGGPAHAAYVSDPWAGGLIQPAAKKPYVLPSSFRTDAQSASPDAAKPYALPSGFKTDVQSAPPRSAPSSSPSSVIHELKVVEDAGSRTLAIVLAATALGIALCGTGLALVRLTRMQRRVLGSSS